MVLDELRVQRGTPSLVRPARATPRESKPLSDIDDQETMRFYSTVFHLYPYRLGRFDDPAPVVRRALAEALVHYYPLAGRLREEAAAGGKLVVDCDGQGVVYVEADADVAADELGDDLRSQLFVYHEHGSDSDSVVGRPLLYVQLTRLRCGGFIVATRTCHCISDVHGVAQFWRAVGEIARLGASNAPRVPPVWAREIFSARRPPRPSAPHAEYRQPDGYDRVASTPPQQMERVQLCFGPDAISALRGRAGGGGGGAASSRHDLVAACVWRSRTAALGYAPGDEVRLMMSVDARSRHPDGFGIRLPAGYYGNASAYTVACCAAGELCGRGLGHAVGLVREAKARVTYEYMRSVADTMALEGRPLLAWNRTFVVLSDLGYAGFDDVDFGWGKPVYGGGVVTDALGFLPGGATSFQCRDYDETFVAIHLPGDCTARYRMEVKALTTTTTTTTMEAPVAALRARY